MLDSKRNILETETVFVIVVVDVGFRRRAPLIGDKYLPDNLNGRREKRETKRMTTKAVYWLYVIRSPSFPS